MAAVYVTLIFVSIWCSEIRCAQVIPERAGVVSFNKKYVDELKFYVKRYSRRGNYYLNLEGIVQQEWNNNVSVHLDFYEYLHNEYKTSFVEMHFRLCDMVNKDPYVGKAVANAGMPCPLTPGKVVIHNITVPMNEFPNVWPFERCKVDIRCLLTLNKETILNIEAYVYFKNRDTISKYDKKTRGLY